MPVVSSALRALRTLFLRGGHRVEGVSNGLRSQKLNQVGECGGKQLLMVRYFGGVTGRGNFMVDGLIGPENERRILTGDSYRTVQARSFLGCGDGQEENVLSKTHEERIVVGYSPEQVFGVVAAVDLYQDFVPWCQRSKVVRRNNDGSFDAELEIGFKFLVESYVSHVELNKPKFIKTTVSQSNLFEHLINIWEFNPGPAPGTCNLYFLVDFKFQSPLYRQMALVFFKEVVSQLVGSFTDRCRRVYGPGTEVLEKSYGQGL